MIKLTHPFVKGFTRYDHYPSNSVRNVNMHSSVNNSIQNNKKQIEQRYDYVIVGCGLSGAVIAERIASQLKKTVLIIEKRDHIGGNCYDYVDDETKILVNKYGAHIFHTNYQDVWEYVNLFAGWKRWDHEVLAYVDDKYVPIPVNLTTINALCNENLQTEDEVKIWLEKNQKKYDNIENSEQVAKSRIGNTLYEKLIKEYTYKQWGVYPEKLNKSVLERIPVRASNDGRYFNDKYQALPSAGYTNFFEKLLDNPLITILLNTDYFVYKSQNDLSKCKVIYTGPIDLYFKDSGLPKLQYRSINFHTKRYKTSGYMLPNSVINYPDKSTPYTRSVEYKHFLNQKSDHTIIISETTTDKGEPYYPFPNAENIKLYEEYQKLAINEEKKGVYFVGRLANYKYFNMDQAIKNSLDFFSNTILPNFREREIELKNKLKDEGHCIIVARYTEDVSWLDIIG
jgi:UDP-galactopyranose mutase